jgi:hypothetical protein
VNMPNSFFSISAFSGPTPLRYSIGCANMLVRIAI